MSAEYRRKLVNWLTSMLVLHLIVLVSLLYEWLTRTVDALALNPDSPEIWAWLLSESISAYIVYLSIFCIWHGSEFAQRGTPGSRWVQMLGSYRALIGVFCLLGLSILFNQTRWLDDLGCPEEVLPPGVFVFDGCGSWTPWWKELILLILALSFVGLTIAKMAISVASRFRRTDQLLAVRGVIRR